MRGETAAGLAKRRAVMGGILRSTRQRLGWTQKAVADRARVTVPFLSDLELGKRSVSPKRLHALATALSLSWKDYVKLFQLRQRLPPEAERRMLIRPDLW